ncbi:Short-chain dehydrogenase [Parafrankia irregularis]|uniref:Short-chain dehydrogenase n=1 Tax=Parafrankia irregularis TaxID=795642 RepID=A0A0S4QN08_9ACTN|nr:SDR family oxidoreductase [Parafrankia sp. CH37]MBE3206085.1 SDR family oxidoreductase [Parafrankia sp. CH37]CUU57031.1 Short-chain dehydrogenase [Parafrankia irregularis]
MLLAGKLVVVTGGGSGIGAALAVRAAAEGASTVVVSDVNLAAAKRVAEIAAAQGCRTEAVRVDVADRADIDSLIRCTEKDFGPVDVFCSNAGIAVGAGLEARPRQWAGTWSVNVMAHVHVAQALLPAMVDRGSGALLITASAAGLLGLPGDAPYSVTKAAAVALAEWLALSYGGRGVQISALCPLGVNTDMLRNGFDSGHPSARAVVASAPVLEPEQVARCAFQGLAANRFLITPHHEVDAAFTEKAADIDEWLSGRRASLFSAASRTSGGI